MLFRGGCFYALSVKAFYGLLLTDTTAYIKRRVWRFNGVYGGVMV